MTYYFPNYVYPNPPCQLSLWEETRAPVNILRMFYIVNVSVFTVGILHIRYILSFKRFAKNVSEMNKLLTVFTNPSKLRIYL